MCFGDTRPMWHAYIDSKASFTHALKPRSQLLCSHIQICQCPNQLNRPFYPASLLVQSV